MNINFFTNYVCVLLPILTFFNFNFSKSNNYTITLIYLYISIVIYKYNYSFYTISTYYQIIAYLNTKNNILLLCTMYSIYTINCNNSTTRLFAVVLIYYIYDYNVIEISKLYYIYYINSINILNNNLLNGVMLIHPIILYLYYIFYLYLLNNINIYIKNVNVHTNYKYYTLQISSCIIVSIILGCWWAEQELSWGGWWSWDLVEVLALNFLIINLINIHTNKYILENNYKNLKIYFYIFINVLLFVRFNIINSIHNFINSESQNQYLFYIKYVYIYISFIIIYFFMFFFLKKFNKKYKYIVPTFILVTTLYIFYVNILLIYIINYNLQISKLYISIMFLYLLHFCNSSILYKNNYSALFLLFLYVVNVLTYSDIFILYIILIVINYNTNKKNLNKNIHTILILLLYFTLHQVYVFKFYEINFIYNYVYLNKINFFYTSNYLYVYNEYNSMFIKLKFFLYYLFEIKNNNVFIENFFKNVFEKKINICDFNIYELYNYNLQQLNQPNSVIVFLLLLLLLIFIWLLVMGVTKKVNI